MIELMGVRYFDSTEVQQMFGVGRNYMTEINNSMPVYKVGKFHYYKEQDLQTWFESQIVKSPTAVEEAQKKNEGEQEVTATSQVSQVSRHNEISNTVEIDFNILLSAVQEEHISQVMERINQMQDEADLLKVSTIEWLLNHAKAECKEPLKDYLYSARAEMEKGNKIECVS